MKKIYLLAMLMTLAGTMLYAQAPKGFNYQAVIRNSSGQIVTNKEVNVRINIRQGSETGSSVYYYSEHVWTNENGVITIVVGENSPQYAAINWANGPYFLQSEIDIANGNDFALSTTQKIMSVPYAEFASVADHVSSTFTYDEQDPKFKDWGYLYDSLVNAPTRLSQFINDLNYLTANDIQLSINGDTLFISGGNYVILPNDISSTTIYWDSVIGRPTNLSQFYNDLSLSDFYNDMNFHVSGDTIFYGDTYGIVHAGSTSIPWDSVINHPTNLSQFINDLNLSDFNDDLDVHMNGDTLFIGDSYVIINGISTSVLWDSVINHPTNLSQFFNDLNLSDFYNDLNVHMNGDTLFIGDKYVIVNNGPSTISWDSVIGHPTNLSQFINDLNLSDFNNDLNLSDFNNDLNLTVSGDTLFYGTNKYVILPQNLISSIDWSNITNRPTNLSQFNNDMGFLTGETQGLNDVLSVNNYAGNTITGLTTPTADLDAVNKRYADSLAAAMLASLNNQIDSLVIVIDSLTAQLADAMNMNDSVNSTVDSLVHPSIPGLLPGKFSIGPNRKVQFSMGNLQYRPNIKLFRFAANQYEIGDNLTVGTGETCDLWTDLFPFGTSGWSGGRAQYMPNSTGSIDYQYAFPTDLGDGSLTGYTANGDWGIFNPIINGGNQMATWRTLTDNEWNHLLNNRPNAANLKALAIVNGQRGLIILPDDWDNTTISMSLNTTVYETNNYNVADWNVLEAAGAVFLPSAGKRQGVTIDETSSVGYYWSSTRTPGQYKGSAVVINVGASTTLNSTDFSQGCSVRLVRDY